jgi:hypothetical protein
MTWTREQVAARLAERERYRAEHPEFSDPELRAARRGAKRQENRRMHEARWAGLAYHAKEAIRRRRQRQAGMPRRRARMETMRRWMVAQGRPEPSAWELRALVREQEQREREAYKDRGLPCARA